MNRLLMIVLSLLLSSCGKDDSVSEIALPPPSGRDIRIVVGSSVFVATLYDTPASEAFRAMLPLTLNMSDMSANEKYANLSRELPTLAIRPKTISSGDLMLYGSSTLVLFYKTFSSSYSYTRIGRVDKPLELEAVLGRGSISVRFEESAPQVLYSLTYNTNGATSGSTPRVAMATKGSVVALDSGLGLSRDGYAFVGWNTNTSGTGISYNAGSRYAINSNVTLYAKWEMVVNNRNTMKITVGSNVFTATLADNGAVRAFVALLPLTLNMSELNNNEKYANLSQSLPTLVTSPSIINNGDIMLYGSSTLVLFYKTFSSSYSYTRIGRIDDPLGLQSALGGGGVTVKFE